MNTGGIEQVWSQDHRSNHCAICASSYHLYRGLTCLKAPKITAHCFVLFLPPRTLWYIHSHTADKVEALTHHRTTSQSKYWTRPICQHMLVSQSIGFDLFSIQQNLLTQACRVLNFKQNSQRSINHSQRPNTSIAAIILVYRQKENNCILQPVIYLSTAGDIACHRHKQRTLLTALPLCLIE